MERFSRRRLPHWQPDAKVFLVTFRLFGSLPLQVIEELQVERERLRRQPPRVSESPRDRALREAKRLFGLTDKALAEQLREPDCPQWLGNPQVAAVVQDAIRYRDRRVFGLHRHTILPNHVHLLIEPLAMEQAGGSHRVGRFSNRQVRQAAIPPDSWSLSAILHSLKRHTSRQANKILGRSGTFWQDESHDHWVRDMAEYGRIVEYIDQNPVQAGLCKEPADWPWSSAGEDRQVANPPHLEA